MIKHNLILCGLPGVGKTIIGKHCAQFLRCPFLDTDQIIETTYGLPCRELFLKDGRKNFRSYETLLLKSLYPMGGHVISLGGGIVEEEENLQWIRQLGMVIHLTCDLDILIRRKVYNDTPAYLEISHVSHKFALNRESEFRALAAHRLPIYEDVKDVTIDVSRLSVEKIIELILKYTEENGKQ